MSGSGADGESIKVLEKESGVDKVGKDMEGELSVEFVEDRN